MFLRYLQFGLLFSGALFVLKAAGAPGLAVWTWLGCFIPVVLGALFCIIFAMADTAVEALAGYLNQRGKRKAAKGYL